MGHQFVKKDWTRFRPTKAVKRSQYPEWTCERTSESSTKKPAMSLRYLSTVMVLLLSAVYFFIRLASFSFSSSCSMRTDFIREHASIILGLFMR